MEDRKRLVLEAAELRAMMEKAAEEGAKKALASVGLHDEDAADDVRNLRNLLSDWREFRSAAMRAVGNAVALGLLGIIGAGLFWYVHRGPRP
jgi:hypothetical protein